MNYTRLIYKALKAKNYDNAREYTGVVLHTIHDFYSHSNWVEMNFNVINIDIGTNKFNSKYKVASNKTPTCVNNCELVEVKCSRFVSILWSIVKLTGINSSIIKCNYLNNNSLIYIKDSIFVFKGPLRYYKCKNNLKDLNNLVSGYSVNEKLPDGSPVEKPTSYMKCSHGGVLDNSSFKPAKGGNFL